MKLTRKAKEELIERFGDGEFVNFEEAERVIYSHDMGSLPQIVDRMIDTVPQAVVRVRDIEDLKFIINFSRKFNIPLTPRGNATSGYGDAMPFGKGIALDFMYMRKVINLSEDELTVEVEPGIVFWNLEKYLNGKGYSLRVYPSSAPGATVGGWIGEGGSGIGSYKYGYFRDNISEIEAVLPDGSVRVFSGDDIDLIYSAQGTTGLISRVKIKIHKNIPLTSLLLRFNKSEDLAAYLFEISQKELNIYHANCFIGESLERRIKVLKESKGQKFPIFADPEVVKNLDLDSIEVINNGAYLLLSVEGETINPEILDIAGKNGGSKESELLAKFLWGERFYPMREKRLGPSLIPSEAVISIEALPKVCKEVRETIEDVSLEGNSVGKNEVVMLGFALHDERTFAFSFDYVKSLVMMDIIEKYGGRLYSVGIFFTDKADKIKGKEKMDKLRKFKAEYDPKNLLNPGKLFPSRYVPTLLKVALKAGKGSRTLAGLTSNFLSKTPKTSKKIASDIVYEAFACAQCGYCKVVCSEYMGKGWESSAPRGKFYFLREYARGKKNFSKYLSNNFLLCTTCKRCNTVCQVNIPIQEKWDDMRGYLVQDKGFPTFPAFEMMGGSYEQARNIWTGRISERDKWLPDNIEVDLNEPLDYWAGCTASYVENDISINSVRILENGGVKFNYLGNEESCCGIPFMMAGKWDLFEKVVRYNVKKFKERGIKQIVTSCPGCWVSLTHYYNLWTKKLNLNYDVKVFHITQVTDKLVREGRLKFNPINETITYHDPCHIGRHGGIYDEPRNILNSIPGTKLVEMEHNREDGLCCGSVLTRVGEPKISDKIADVRLNEAKTAGAEKIITNCPCCEFQFRVAGKSLNNEVEVEDIATYIVRALGYVDSPDPVPQIHYMWGVFAKAIQMMSSSGIVNMMNEMFPEMVNAMPPLFRGMTHSVMNMPKIIRKPFAAMFKGLLPSLMPMLLPGMLPKLAPDIQKLMEKEMPDMPDSMKEMMPKMLPDILSKVMKGVLPDVAPEIASNFKTFLMNS